MTFLTIITRSFQRPQQLARCVQSVARQSDPDVEHVLVHDPNPAGSGIGWSYENLRNVAVNGDYVFLLDDDDYLIDDQFVAKLKAALTLALSQGERVDVLIFRMDLLEMGVLPVDFGEPRWGGIAVSCFAVRREVWHEHVMDLKACYEADWRFIHAIWACPQRHVFLPLPDLIAARIGGRNLGQAERGDFAAVSLSGAEVGALPG